MTVRKSSSGSAIISDTLVFNEINKCGGWISFCGERNFSKSISVNSTFIRKMRVSKDRRDVPYYFLKKNEGTLPSFLIKVNTILGLQDCPCQETEI